MCENTAVAIITEKIERKRKWVIIVNCVLVRCCNGHTIPMSHSVCACVCVSSHKCVTSVRVCCGSNSATVDCEVYVLGFITNLGSRKKERKTDSSKKGKKGVFSCFMRVLFEQCSLKCQTLMTHT